MPKLATPKRTDVLFTGRSALIATSDHAGKVQKSRLHPAAAPARCSHTIKSLPRSRTSPGKSQGAIHCGGGRFHPVSFRRTRSVSQPLRPSNLAHILGPASIEQIGQMDHEGALLPDDFNQRNLRVVPDFDAGSTRKCGRVVRTDWDGNDRLPRVHMR